jgi:hypothetical protein
MKKANKDKNRFYKKVNKTDSCHEWTACKNPAGYGLFNFGGQGMAVLAHRFAWEISNGDIPDGMLVCHKCDNPSCVNPEHLFIGSHKDNMRDCVNKGRFVCNLKTKGHKSFGKNNGTHTKPDSRVCGIKNGNSKFIDSDILKIKKLYKSGVSTREIAAIYRVGKSTIWNIVSGNGWKHVQE